MYLYLRTKATLNTKMFCNKSELLAQQKIDGHVLLLVIIMWAVHDRNINFVSSMLQTAGVSELV